MRSQSARSRDGRVPRRDGEFRGGDGRLALAPRRGDSVSFRIPRVVVPFLAAAILALSVTQVAFGSSPLTTAWQAKVGTSGLNGTANVSTVTTGAGSIGLKLVKLRASSTLPVVLYKGTCASVGAVLFRLASITTSSTGAASRTNTLSAAQVNQILAATTGTGKVAIRVGSGTSAKCGAFAKRTVLGPQAVVQAFYDWWVTSHDYRLLFVRPDVTPGFVQWFKSWNVEVDPILCAQANPDSVKAGPAAISGSSATLTTTEVWNGEPLPGPKVKIALGPAGWQISAVDCGF
jgi:hypothetical protein